MSDVEGDTESYDRRTISSTCLNIQIVLNIYILFFIYRKKFLSILKIEQPPYTP